MKNIKRVLLLITVTLASIVLVACNGEDKTLEKPASVSLATNFIYWEVVEEAEKYNVYVNDSLFDTTTENSFDLTKLNRIEGELTIYITAEASGYLVSPKTDNLIVVRAGDGNYYISGTEPANSLDTPTKLEVNSTNGTLTWEAVLNADEYEIYFNDSLFGTVTTNVYELSNLNRQNGDLTLYVIAKGAEYTTSEPSVSVTLVRENEVYYLKDKKLSAPTDLTVLDSRLSWTSVPNAKSYEIYIGSETISNWGSNSINLKLYSSYIDKETPVYVVAVGDNYRNSDPSTTILLTKVMTDIYLSGDEPGAGEYTGYYKDLTGLEGEALIDKLEDILNTGVSYLAYVNTTNVLKQADQHPTDSTSIMGMYDHLPIKKDQYPDVWNKEHIWPQSSFGEAEPFKSDMHHIRAASASTNETRSNYFFNNILGATDGWVLGTQRFFPGKRDKGDVARMLMYVAVAYRDDGFKLVVQQGGYTNDAGRKMGNLEVLLQWHLDDPVDEFERNRNEVIYSYQGNRNPFIDLPELFEPIYDFFMSIAIVAYDYYDIITSINYYNPKKESWA